MPSARSATATPRRAPAPRPRRAPAPRPRHTTSRRAQRPLSGRPRRRVRWDRVGRVTLLVVLAVVIGLYVKQALAYLAVRSQADQQSAIVHRLVRENARLATQQRALNDPGTIVRDARALGMVRPGEHPYVITGLLTR